MRFRIPEIMLGFLLGTAWVAVPWALHEAGNLTVDGTLISLMSASISSLAAAVTAYFTYTIRNISRNQLGNSRIFERAYMSCGEVPRTVPTQHLSRGDAMRVSMVSNDTFEFHVNNHGKTPGRMLQFAIEFCDAEAIPPEPDYHPIHFKDWIGPGTQS